MKWHIPRTSHQRIKQLAFTLISQMGFTHTEEEETHFTLTRCGKTQSSIKQGSRPPLGKCIRCGQHTIGYGITWRGQLPGSFRDSCHFRQSHALVNRLHFEESISMSKKSLVGDCKNNGMGRQQKRLLPFRRYMISSNHYQQT